MITIITSFVVGLVMLIIGASVGRRLTIYYFVDMLKTCVTDADRVIEEMELWSQVDDKD